MPYFLKDNATFAGISVNKINLNNRTEYIREARVKYDSYNTSEWKKKYFDENTGGYLVVEKDRIYQSQKSKNEKEKFNREQGMNMILARNGHSVEHLYDQEKEKYDIRLDGINTELKKTGSHNNMVNYAKDAIRKKGANMVVFEFENNTKKIQEELNKLKRLGIKTMYYFSNDKSKIHTL